MPRHRLMSEKDYQRIEVITGSARRRRWSTEQKLRIIEDSYEAGASHDREIIAWRAVAGGGISGDMIRDMMLEAIETRFGGLRAL